MSCGLSASSSELVMVSFSDVIGRPTLAIRWQPVSVITTTYFWEDRGPTLQSGHFPCAAIGLNFNETGVILISKMKCGGHCRISFWLSIETKHESLVALGFHVKSWENVVSNGKTASLVFCCEGNRILTCMTII